MASLIAPLVSGIAGAPSGTVELFRAGTAALAVAYSDAEGETAVTAHTLDAYGAVVRYVEERVDVVVKNVVGATVRTFTWGTDARDARVENLGFTGPDASGAIVAGGRTTVDRALTSLFGSFGSTDGLVLVNGVATTLSGALNQSAGLVYNVKSGYGAIGNGTTNDSPSVQAAINAADAAGGGIIFFPHGTYLLSSAITVANSTGKFFFLGEAASGSKLKQGTSATVMLALGNGNENTLMNLTFTATAANTGTLVSVGTTARATFLSCTFDALNGTTIATGASGTSRANLIGCTIAQAGASSRIASGVGYLRLSGCDISTSGADLTSFSDALFVVSIGCNWALGSAINGGTTVIYNNAGSLIQFVGGEINSAFTSGTTTICAAGGLMIMGVQIDGDGDTLTLAGASVNLFEAGCSFTPALGLAGHPTIGVPGVTSYSASRLGQVLYTDLTAAVSYTPSIAYNVHEITSTGAAMAINNPSSQMPTGWPLTIAYKNGNGAGVTPTFGTDYTTATVTIAVVPTTQTGLYYFLPRFGGLTNDLVCIAAAVGVV